MYKIRVKKYNKECLFINKINKVNKQYNNNFNHFTNSITHMSHIEYSSLIKSINESYLNNNKKEYCHKLNFIQHK